MGAWGPGIFADDEAEDLRDEYRMILADAQSDAAATDAAARSYDASFERPEETTAFWLALAMIQWRLGRLDPRVRDVALRIIDDGLDLVKWEGSPLRSKRATALKKARDTIASPAPAEKPMPKPLPLQLPGWEFSEVLGYPMPNGRMVLLHHLNYRGWSLVGAKAPVITVLNWFGTEMPDERQVAALTYINHDGLMVGGHHLLCLAMPARKSLQPSQFIRHGYRKPVTRDEATSAVRGIGGHEGRTLDMALNQVLAPYWRDPSIPPHLPKTLPADRDEARRVLDYWNERVWGDPTNSRLVRRVE
jgi:hypothetical protein